MARIVKDKLKTDIAIGITGTTGNIDPNNPDSVQGQVYFVLLQMAGKTHFGLVQMWLA